MTLRNITNLNRYRKSRNAEAKRQAADENAIKFGRSKAKKIKEKMQHERLHAKTDAHKLDDPSG